MNAALLKTVFGAGCLSLVIVGSASAGGFSRGSADTDILYEDGNFVMRTGVTYVSPKRKYSSFDAAPGLVGTSYTDDYVIPSAAVKFNLGDNFRCAGTLVDNNGGSATYAVPKPSGKLNEDFTTNEKAVTCGVKFQAGPGNVWVLGGGFVENFNYDRVNVLPSPPFPGGSRANLVLKGQDYGYRIGAAYEIPEIAFRTQLLYRSGTSYGAEGTLNVPIFGAIPASGHGNLPQSVEWKVQSGIAPGWLAFGSAKWADWSVQKELLVKTPNPLFGSEDTYNWKDGWTLTGGVGHAFNDNVSGALSLTWDQGVTTGWDLSSDTYTLAAGGVLRDSWGGELRGGVGATYLTSAAETMYAVGENSAVDSGWAFAVNLGYKVKW